MRVAAAIALAALVALLGCAEIDEADPRAPSTLRMIERLEALRLDVTNAVEADDPWRLPDPEAGERLRAELAESPDPRQRVALRFRLAEHYLLTGRSADALGELERLEALAYRSTAPFPREQVARLQELIGTAALRAAEERFCVAEHRGRSCIFPIVGDGVHRDPALARRAAEAFANQRALEPAAQRARWLLNLATMTAGDDPAALPEADRLPASLTSGGPDFPEFPDRAAAAGLDTVGLAGGAVVDDFDGDGDFDVFASSWAPGDRLRFFVNRGDGTFEDATRRAGLAGLPGGLNLSHADYDNDGRNDLLVLRGGWLGEAGRIPNSLLRNRGDGTFEDVTEAAGLFAEHPTHAAAWGDVDNDGWLDLFVGSEERDPRRPHPSALYRNRGDGTFEEIAGDLGIDRLGFVKGAAFGDVDDDGWIDLYVSRFGADNLLLRNLGDGRGFEEIAGTAGVTGPWAGFPVWFFDYDNDGRLDLLVAAWDGASIETVAAGLLGESEEGEGPRLYRNRGDGTFEDVSAGSGLASVLLTMGANFGDLDNDGWLDLYLGTGAPDLRTLMPNRMFRNVAGRRFEDVTLAGGFGHLQKGHGVAFADVDGDGDQDVFTVMGGWFPGDVSPDALFVNPGTSATALGLQLVGERSNRNAVGARVTVRLGGSFPRTIHRQVDAGGSFGDSPFALHVGLGTDPQIDSVEVRWPSGLTQSFSGLAPGRRYLLHEGREAAVAVLSSMAR